MTATLAQPAPTLTREEIEARRNERRNEEVQALRRLYDLEYNKGVTAVEGIKRIEEALTGKGIDPSRVLSTTQQVEEPEEESEMQEMAILPVAQPGQYRTHNAKEANAIHKLSQSVQAKGFTIKELHNAKLDGIDTSNKEGKQRLANEVYAMQQAGFLVQTDKEREGHNVYVSSRYAK